MDFEFDTVVINSDKVFIRSCRFHNLTINSKQLTLRGVVEVRNIMNLNHMEVDPYFLLSNIDDL